MLKSVWENRGLCFVPLFWSGSSSYGPVLDLKFLQELERDVLKIFPLVWGLKVLKWIYGKFSKNALQTAILGFSRGSFVILWKTRVFGVNITFNVLMWYLEVLKYVKLVTEQESKLRRNILISEYFFQDDNPPSSDVLDLACKAVSTDLAYNTNKRCFQNICTMCLM